MRVCVRVCACESTRALCVCLSVCLSVCKFEVMCVREGACVRIHVCVRACARVRTYVWPVWRHSYLGWVEPMVLQCPSEILQRPSPTTQFSG